MKKMKMKRTKELVGELKLKEKKMMKRMNPLQKFLFNLCITNFELF